MNPQDEIFAEVEAPTDAQLRRVAELARRQIEQEDDVARLEAELKEAGAALQQTSGVDLPELFAEIGLSSASLDSGERIEVQRNVKASIAKKNAEEAHAWLRDNGHGSLIKNEVTCSFGRGEEDKAAEFFDSCVERDLVAKRKEGVHAQTLSAFVREQIQEGNDIPMELLGVFEYSVTKITR